MIPRVADMLRSLASYRPPPFPGVRDEALAAQGRETFASRCAQCHGRYDDDLAQPHLLEYPNRLVPQARIGTDSLRWTLVNRTVLDWQDAHAKHPFVRHVETARTGGYVAPILSGLWITAPYLHNGSVPTLWHLMHPDQRPARFEVGGHRLDYQKVGIALVPGEEGVQVYPPGYQPVSRRDLYDTSGPGRSNVGHEFPFVSMSEIEKAALLEYLKRL
jgi:mono/diheme cytochrome c family protein